jgi:hypothetical protein
MIFRATRKKDQQARDLRFWVRSSRLGLSWADGPGLWGRLQVKRAAATSRLAG